MQSDHTMTLTPKKVCTRCRVGTAIIIDPVERLPVCLGCINALEKERRNGNSR